MRNTFVLAVLALFALSETALGEEQKNDFDNYDDFWAAADVARAAH